MSKDWNRPGFHANVDELPLIQVQHSGSAGTGSVNFKMVYGEDTGLMVAKRDQGYHSKPHYHDCEQFNYILDGELWFFIEEEGYLCRKGDIVRVPRNAIHWVWVRDPNGCTMLETHTAPLTGDPKLANGAVALAHKDEDFSEPIGVDNTFTDYENLEAVEKRTFEKYGVSGALSGA